MELTSLGHHVIYIYIKVENAGVGLIPPDRFPMIVQGNELSQFAWGISIREVTEGVLFAKSVPVFEGSGSERSPIPKIIGSKRFPAVDLVTPLSIRSQRNHPSRNFGILPDGSRRTDFP